MPLTLQFDFPMFHFPLHFPIVFVKRGLLLVMLLHEFYWGLSQEDNRSGERSKTALLSISMDTYILAIKPVEGVHTCLHFGAF